MLSVLMPICMVVAMMLLLLLLLLVMMMYIESACRPLVRLFLPVADKKVGRWWWCDQTMRPDENNNKKYLISSLVPARLAVVIV